MIKRWRLYTMGDTLHFADESIKWPQRGRLLNDRIVATQEDMDKMCILATQMQLDVCQCHLNRRGHER
jgi:hypothetical protein